MTIYLKKFGTTLTGRQFGKESYAAFKPTLREINESEEVEIDFEGVITFTPSWGDEFLSSLSAEFGDKVILKNTENPSVKATLDLLEDIHKKKFRRG
ncbi:MAG: DUF4325 domain-containing protein [bacterium]